MKTTAWLVRGLLLSLALAGIAAADDEESEAEQQDAAWLEKRSFEWGLAGNFGFSHQSTSPGRHLTSFAIRFGRVMTDPVGPGFLRGSLAFNLELLPAFLFADEDTTYAAGFNLLGRHYLDRLGAVRPFITVGIGTLISTDAIPEGTSQLNFTPQAGVGVAFSDAHHRMYTIEYRFHHISNGGRIDPNPGINSSVVQFGITFLRNGSNSPSN